jgi:hypothetical protein
MARSQAERISFFKMQTTRNAATLFCALAGTFLTHATEVAKPSALAECASILCARSDAANSVVARLHVTLHDRARGKDFELNGAYLGDVSGNIRLRVTTEGGQLVLDMGMRGETIDICMPGKSLYLSGTRNELLDHPRCHLALLAQCGRVRELFFPAGPAKSAIARRSCCVNGRAYCNVAETAALLPRYLTRLTLDVNTGVLERKEIFSRGGADAGSVDYSNYRFPEAGPAPIKPAYPGRVTLHVPGDAFVLDLDVEDLSFNTPIADAKFTIPVPNGFKRETLADALQRNVNIWEP